MANFLAAFSAALAQGIALHRISQSYSGNADIRGIALREAVRSMTSGSSEPVVLPKIERAAARELVAA